MIATYLAMRRIKKIVGVMLMKTANGPGLFAITYVRLAAMISRHCLPSYLSVRVQNSIFGSGRTWQTPAQLELRDKVIAHDQHRDWLLKWKGN